MANSIKIWKTVERQIGGPFKFCNSTPLWHNINFVCGNRPFVQPSWSSLGVNTCGDIYDNQGLCSFQTLRTKFCLPASAYFQGRVQDFILGVAKGGQEQNEGWQLGLSPGAQICKISVAPPPSKKISEKMSVMVEFEVFTKMSSLSLLLAIPMLQIVMKHLKLSLFVHFLREVPFCPLLDDCCCFSPQVVGLLLQSAAFQLCK